MTASPAPTVTRGRLLLFALGDFAFNLYWQSVMLFLLFYYTDALELPMAAAATTYMIASIWDGFANFAAGVMVDRRRGRRGFGTLLAFGGIPLSLCFALAYLPPPVSGASAVAIVLITHLLFRTGYAGVNVTYLAMSARVSASDDDRAFVAGLRMLFGTAAAVTVALATVPVGRWLTGSTDAAQAYLGSAILFAVLGSIILLVVGLTYRDAVMDHPPAPATVRQALGSLARNRAFVILNVAMMAMIVAITVLNKSVLYYFKYVIGDQTAGQLALASMGLISAAAVPAWMALGRMFGLRNCWLLAAAAAMAGLVLFGAVDITRAGSMQLFLMGMQVMIVGLNFAFWAMLPSTIEYGERATGLHVEGTVFGLAALLQRIAIGIATAIIGWSYSEAGFVANAHQGATVLANMRSTIALAPLLFLLVSFAATLANPLGRRRAAA